MLSIVAMWDAKKDSSWELLAGESEKLLLSSKLPSSVLANVRNRLQNSCAEPFPETSDPPSSPSAIASFVDHTLLDPSASDEQFLTICEEARSLEFATICVPSNQVRNCVDQLRDAPTKVITVVGFPLGYNEPEAMAYEAELALAAGAAEIDMVIPYGKALCGGFDEVFRSVSAVAAVAQRFPRALLKTILETSALPAPVTVIAALVSLQAGSNFLKTSTGFSKFGGAKVTDVEILRRCAGSSAGVKASGGIRDLETALRMIAAGASRLGTSASVAIVSATKPLSAEPAEAEAY